MDSCGHCLEVSCFLISVSSSLFLSKIKFITVFLHHRKWFELTTNVFESLLQCFVQDPLFPKIHIEQLYFNSRFASFQTLVPVPGNNCNCCRCPSPPRFPPQPNFPTLIPQYQSSYAYSYSPHPIAPIVYAQSPTPTVPVYTAPLFTTTASYRGPPAAAPTSQEQLYQERKYSTNQVAYHSG